MAHSVEWYHLDAMPDADKKRVIFRCLQNSNFNQRDLEEIREAVDYWLAVQPEIELIKAQTVKCPTMEDLPF
jgi:hypothetical protein